MTKPWISCNQKIEKYLESTYLSNHVMFQLTFSWRSTVFFTSYLNINSTKIRVLLFQYSDFLERCGSKSFRLKTQHICLHDTERQTWFNAYFEEIPFFPFSFNMQICLSTLGKVWSYNLTWFIEVSNSKLPKHKIAHCLFQ